AQRTKEILRESALAGLALNHRQLALVRHAVDHPGFLYTIETHRRYHNVSYQTARNDLLELSELKLLPMSKQGRKFLFLSPDDLRHRL
ncbi:MAG: Fic family protein, partial [Candidatus Krumholzibacteriota bacterium]